MDERVSIRDCAKSLKKYGSTNNNNGLKKPETYVKHMISSTDTLQGIALKYGVTTEQIRRANRLWANDSLFLRESLLIPVPLVDPGGDSLLTSPSDISLFDISECGSQFLNYGGEDAASAAGRSSTNVSRSSSFRSDSGASGISSSYNGFDMRNGRSASSGDLKNGSGAATPSSNGASSTNGHYDPDAFTEFLVRIDCDIASTRSQVIQAQGKSQFRPSDDDCIFLSKRKPLSRRKQQEQQSTALPSVVTQGSRVRTSLQKLQESHDELFEL